MMKKLLLGTTIASAIIFTGCGQKEPLPINYSINKTKDTVYLYGTINRDDDNVNTLQNLAIQIKEAAKILKENGYDYFIINPAYQIPFSINSMKTLSEYCYPENNGFKVDDFEDKSSSLEEKCKSLRLGNISSRVYLKGFKEAQFTLPTWNAQQVLSDPYIDNFILSALEEGDYENKTITLKLVETKNGDL